MLYISCPLGKCTVVQCSILPAKVPGMLTPGMRNITHWRKVFQENLLHGFPSNKIRLTGLCSLGSFLLFYKQVQDFPSCSSLGLKSNTFQRWQGASVSTVNPLQHICLHGHLWAWSSSTVGHLLLRLCLLTLKPLGRGWWRQGQIRSGVPHRYLCSVSLNQLSRLWTYILEQTSLSSSLTLELCIPATVFPEM